MLFTDNIAKSVLDRKLHLAMSTTTRHVDKGKVQIITYGVQFSLE